MLKVIKSLSINKFSNIMILTKRKT